MKQWTWCVGLILGLSLLMGACAEESVIPDDGAVCQEANAHLAMCFGQQASEATSCNSSEAERILNADCQQLSTSLGKADAWWCNSWNSSWALGCGGSDGGNDDSDQALASGSITGRVDHSWDSIGSSESSVSCALVVIRDAEGQEVARTHSANTGGYRVDDLDPGEYTVTLYNRFGEDDEHIPLTLREEPAVSKVVVTEDGEAPYVKFFLPFYSDGTFAEFTGSDAPQTSDTMDRCASVSQTVQVQDVCGQDVTPYYDIQRDWAVILTNEDTGEIVDYAPVWCQPADGDHWAWAGCGKGEEGADVNLVSFGSILPGDYTVQYIRVDLSDRANIDYEDELGWRSQEASPEVLRFSFESRDDSGKLLLDDLLEKPWVITDAWNDDNCE